jgi:hypothetical protein
MPFLIETPERLEIAVTPTKQTTEVSSNRNKIAGSIERFSGREMLEKPATTIAQISDTPRTALVALGFSPAAFSSGTRGNQRQNKSEPQCQK